jgi:hypothetical protein
VEENIGKIIDCLIDTINNDVKKFNKAAKRHKKNHRRFQLAITSLSTLTTVLAGAGFWFDDNKENIEKCLQLATILFSSLTVAVSSHQEARRDKDVWLHERNIHNHLNDLIRELGFLHSNKEEDISHIKIIFQRYMEILKASHDEWPSIDNNVSYKNIEKYIDEYIAKKCKTCNGNNQNPDAKTATE